ncbi:MAG TPA: hypothetical protein VNG95_02420, partial [Gemmatimonadales bacterium]|nr:hypothetical protein [Gemmatimonadales bacterium]
MRVRFGRLRPLIVFMALVGCNDQDVIAPQSLTVTITTSATAVAPGQGVMATVTVIPDGNAEVDYVKLATSGVYAYAESLGVHLKGSFTATRFIQVPISAGTGTLNLTATAAAGGAVANGET